MNHAIVIAAGSGRRMGQDIPKQFINVVDRPVIIYTLAGFQKHPEIDEILVVCLEGWETALQAYAKQFGIAKLTRIVPGGATGQESIRNGVFALEGVAKPDDLVVIHDGIRPLVQDEVLTDVLRVARAHGNAVTAMPYNEQIFVADDEESTVRYIPRDTVRRVATPQAYRYDLLLRSYREAFGKGIGITGPAYTNTMMVDLGVRLYFAAGSDRNIKLTTQADLDLFKAYLAADSSLASS